MSKPVSAPTLSILRVHHGGVAEEQAVEHGISS